MSRSYKKFTVCKEENSRYCKRMANRAVRRAKGILNGCRYKKCYCSWDICDWRIKGKFYTAKQYCRKWFDTSDSEFDYERRVFRNWKDAYRCYLITYRRK